LGKGSKWRPFANPCSGQSGGQCIETGKGQGGYIGLNIVGVLYIDDAYRTFRIHTADAVLRLTLVGGQKEFTVAREGNHVGQGTYGNLTFESTEGIEEENLTGKMRGFCRTCNGQKPWLHGQPGDAAVRGYTH